jgi:hypothetical protein
MIELAPAALIFGICMLGSSWTAFHLGRRDGIECTVQYLIDQGIIEEDLDGEG